MAPYVSSSVDRITPKTTAEDVRLVQLKTGFQDQAPVVTEEFSDWVLSGDFPLGRPDWESAGARFVSELESWESRKLWLLNGAHSLIASHGLRAGYKSVNQAIDDPQIRAAVLSWWEEATAQLPLGMDLENYKSSLLKRFSNPRIAHQLEQIAMEGLTKHSVRFAKVAENFIAQGEIAQGACAALASYIVGLQTGFGLNDSRVAEIEKALAAEDQVLEALRLISDKLASNVLFVNQLRLEVATLSGLDERPDSASQNLITQKKS